MAYLDLDELPEALGPRGCGPRAPALVRFRRADYLGDPAIPLADAVRALVAERPGARPAGPVRLLTNLRYLGHCFNPVSFYYCFDARGEGLQAVVAEVTNTPWGERHAYVLRVRSETAACASAGQGFHVSPFMAMDHEYDCAARPRRARRCSVHIESRKDGEVALRRDAAARAPAARRRRPAPGAAPPARADAADGRAASTPTPCA